MLLVGLFHKQFWGIPLKSSLTILPFFAFNPIEKLKNGILPHNLSWQSCSFVLNIFEYLMLLEMHTEK
jgi:hypothetical protein